MMFFYYSPHDFDLKNCSYSINNNVNCVFNLLLWLRVFGRVRWRRPTVTHRDLNASSEDANHQWSKTLGNDVCCVVCPSVFNHANVGNANNKKRLVLLYLHFCSCRASVVRLSRDYDRARESDSYHQGDSSGTCKFVCLHSFNFQFILLKRGLAISAFQSWFEKDSLRPTIIANACSLK